jgi:nucleoside-diphosphate-sugar epimerase
MAHRQSLISPVMVFGGSGFIGSRLVTGLIAQEHKVRIGDLVESGTHPDLSIFCDVRDEQTLRKPVEGTKTIVNLAAEHRDDVRPLTRYYETNVAGARNVCQVARDAGVPRIVFTSSVAVYGFHPEPVDEDGNFAPFNPYGQTKLEAEQVYTAWADEDPSRTLVIVRPTVVFGEGNRGNVFNLLRQITFCARLRWDSFLWLDLAGISSRWRTLRTSQIFSLIH